MLSFINSILADFRLLFSLISIYFLKPLVRVAHQEGLCNNFNKRRRRRHRPWTVSWTVKPSRVGDFTVTVGYRKDVVRHTIRVQVSEAQSVRRICGDILLQQGHGQKLDMCIGR